MKQMTNEEYVEHEGMCCPHCASEEIAGNDFDMDGGKVYLLVTCLVCNARWYDIYTLSGYDPYSDPTEDK